MNLERSIYLHGKNEDEISTEATGEFDLSYCLFKVFSEQNDFYKINKITVHKSDDIISYTVSMGNDTVVKFRTSINNLIFEVNFND